MERLKAMIAQFRENTRGFFKTEEGALNKKALFAVILAGFVGWLLITVTFGAKLKKALKKVPLIGSVFPKAKRVVRRVKRRSPARRRTTRKY